MPSSLSAKWRRVKIGSLPSFSPSLRMPPKHTLRVRDHQLSGLCASPATTQRGNVASKDNHICTLGIKTFKITVQI